MAGTSVFECNICLSRYNDKEKVPMSLPCGHVFCKLCLKQLKCCPMDDSVFSVDRLPICYAILSHLCHISRVACSLHPKKYVKFLCRIHSSYLCSTCVLDHTGENHEVSRFEPKIHDMKKELHKIAEIAEETISQSIRTEQTLPTISKNINTHYKSEIHKVKNAYDKVIEMLNDKKKERISFLKSSMKEQLNKLDSFNTGLSRNLEKALDVSDEINYSIASIHDYSYSQFVNFRDTKEEELKSLPNGKFEPLLLCFKDNVECNDLCSFEILKMDSKRQLSSSVNSPTKKETPVLRTKLHNHENKPTLTRIKTTNSF